MNIHHVASARSIGMAACAIALTSAAPVRANVVISTAPTQNMNCTGGVCTATAASAVLNITDLQNLLASGNTSVKTGSVALNIVANAPFGWASANSLTLDARRSVTVNKAVTDNGPGGLSIVTNDGSSGGTFSFGGSGSISFLGTGNPVTINGAPYTLVNSISAMASAIAGDASGDFALSRNYDATPDGTYSASPVSTAYGGNFQGFGNTISHLKISNTTTGTNLGLFEVLNSSGSIDNLRMTGVVVGSGARKSIGGMVAINNGKLFDDSVSGTITAGGGSYGGELVGTNNGVVSASHGAGKIRGTNSGNNSAIGGLIGFNAGSIANAASTTQVAIGSDYAGGLIGLMRGGSVTDSSATGDVTGFVSGGLVAYGQTGTISNSFASGSVTASQAGGLIGDLGDQLLGTISVSDSHANGSVNGSASGGFVAEISQGGEVTNCYSTGSVSHAVSESSEVGGFAGANDGTISNSFSTGTVSNVTFTDSNSGGFVGVNDVHGAVENSYAMGSVSNGQNVGGFLGENLGQNPYFGMISDSYSVGSATGGTFNGGFVGDNQTPAGQDYTDAYWDTTTSGTTLAIGTGNSAPITGLTTTQLQSALPAGFDPSIWAESPSVNNGLPYLIANPPPGSAPILHALRSPVHPKDSRPTHRG